MKIFTPPPQKKKEPAPDENNPGHASEFWGFNSIKLYSLCQ